MEAKPTCEISAYDAQLSSTVLEGQRSTVFPIPLSFLAYL